MDLIANTIEHIITPNASVTEKEFILDFLKHCDRNVYTEIRDYNTMLKLETEIKPLTIECTSCENKYEQPFTLNPADFFA